VNGLNKKKPGAPSAKPPGAAEAPDKKYNHESGKVFLEMKDEIA